jgi:hypothetical protein
MTDNETRPVAWMTHHDEPMLFPTREEALTHCDDNEEPIALYTAQALAARDAEIERLRAMTAMTMGVGDGSGKLFVHGDYDSIKAAQALLDEISGLRAARIAYASEFPLNEDGEPDVGSIHANIRALKQRAEQAEARAAAAEGALRLALGWIEDLGGNNPMLLRNISAPLTALQVALKEPE